MTRGNGKDRTNVRLSALKSTALAVARRCDGLLLDWSEPFFQVVLSQYPAKPSFHIRGTRPDEAKLEMESKDIMDAQQKQEEELKDLDNVFLMECLNLGDSTMDQLKAKGEVSLETKLPPRTNFPCGRWIGVTLCLDDETILVEVDDIHMKRHMEEVFTGSLETMFDGFWDWMIKEDYEYMSPQFWRMFGYDPAEKKPKPSEWMEIINKDDLQEALTNLKLHFESKGEHPYTQEVRYTHKNGSTIWVRCKGRVVSYDADGNPSRMIGTHTDITELKLQAEKERNLRNVIENQHKELTAQAKQLQDLISRANAPVIGVDAHGNVMEWNNCIAKLTGFSKQEVLGKPLASFCMRVSDHEVRNFINANKAGKQLNNLTLTLKTKEGKKSKRRLLNKQGETGEQHQQGLSIDSDGDDDVATEVSILANSTIRSEGSIHVGGFLLGQDLTAVLHAKEKLIEESSKAKAEQALNEYVAHEVRNPVFAAQSISDFMLDTLHSLKARPGAEVEQGDVLVSSDTLTELMEHTRIMQASLGYVVDLLTSLLDLNKFLEGRVVSRIEEVDVPRDVVLPVLRIMERRCTAETRVVYEGCSSGVTFKGDSTKLKQVITNLLSNAVKFTSHGIITVRLVSDGSSFTLAVEDTGPGIPFKEAESIFERFSQAAGQSQGCGIGLYLSKLVVERLGGSIYHDPNYHSGDSSMPGARFVVTIPLLDHLKPLLMGSEEEEEGLTCQKEMMEDCLERDGNEEGEDSENRNVLDMIRSILIVDDEPSIRLVLSRRFSKLFPSAKVHVANSGEECLQLCESQAFDLILVDQYMPLAGGELLGTETIQQLRNRGCKSMIVGVSGNQLDQAHKEVGADMSWVKPIPSNTIILKQLLKVSSSWIKRIKDPSAYI